VLARGAGALFIRSYERGERVHLAMLSRGYAGRLLIAGDRSATARDLAAGALLPVLAAAIAVTALVAVS
jgi:cobalt/nickel transport system permease protein